MENQFNIKNVYHVSSETFDNFEKRNFNYFFFSNKPIIIGRNKYTYVCNLSIHKPFIFTEAESWAYPLWLYLTQPNGKIIPEKEFTKEKYDGYLGCPYEFWKHVYYDEEEYTTDQIPEIVQHINLGYDGVIIKNVQEGDKMNCVDDYIVFTPEQIQIVKRMNNTSGNINESMGYNDQIPQELVDYIYKQYLKTCFINRGKKWETSFDVRTGNVAGLPDFVTFVVERGKKGDYYKAAVFNDGTIHLNADELTKVSSDEAKSTIEHELIHITQHEKTTSGERNEGEYGFNKAINANLIKRSERDGEKRNTWLWMMENLEENEIEARLSQIYSFVKSATKDYTPEGNLNEVVKEIVESIESISKLNDLKRALEATETTLKDNNRYFVNLFIKDAQSALFGAQNKSQTQISPFKLFNIYKKRFERYRHRVWNAVYQGLENKKSL